MPYKRKDFALDNSDTGTYVTVYKRDDMEKPLADLNFFEGDHSLETVEAMRNLLDEVIKDMKSNY